MLGACCLLVRPARLGAAARQPLPTQAELMAQAGVLARCVRSIATALPKLSWIVGRRCAAFLMRYPVDPFKADCAGQWNGTGQTDGHCSGWRGLWFAYNVEMNYYMLMKANRPELIGSLKIPFTRPEGLATLKHGL